MTEERLWLLISLQLSGEAHPDELEELRKYLQENPEPGFKKELLAAIWEQNRYNDGRKEESFNKHLQRLSNHFSEPTLQYQAQEALIEEMSPEPRKSSGIYRKLIWTASIAASLIIAFFVFTNSSDNVNQRQAHAQNTVSTKRGSKSKIELPDGTQVWLNADSRITYDENFHGNQREVTLSGEAFFDVVRDESRPFIIHTSTIDVRVLGTAFNVRSYENEKNTETSLIRGSIEVILVTSPDKTKVTLKPKDKLIVNNGKAKLMTDSSAKNTRTEIPMRLARINYKENDSIAIETLWVKNRLAFDGEALEDIALKIERWFDVKVIITDEKMKKAVYTAFFEEENLQQVMEALQLTGKFKYTINKKEVTIRP